MHVFSDCLSYILTGKINCNSFITYIFTYFEKMMLSSITLMINLFFLDNISSYIDPNAGSAIAAAIIGALAGLGITLKLYWEKLKFKLSRKD